MNESRIISNFKDVELKDEDFKTLNSLVESQKTSRMVDAYKDWGVDVFDEY